MKTPEIDLGATWRTWYVNEPVSVGLTNVVRYEARRTRMHPDGPHVLGSNFETVAEAWQACDEDWSG